MSKSVLDLTVEVSKVAPELNEVMIYLGQSDELPSPAAFMLSLEDDKYVIALYENKDDIIKVLQVINVYDILVNLIIDNTPINDVTDDIMITFCILHELGHYIDCRDTGKEAFIEVTLEDEKIMRNTIITIASVATNKFTDDELFETTQEIYRQRSQEVTADTYALSVLAKMYK